MQAKDLRIGMVFERTRNGDPIHIKTLNELCVARPTPHVHVVTSQGSRCLPFWKPVKA